MGGLREVFRNTFCRPYKELGVPGMAELYQRLRGEDGHGVAKGLHFVVSFILTSPSLCIFETD